MDKAKFQELMKKEDFVKKVFESKTSKELESILKKEGLEVSEAELREVMDSIAVLTQTSKPVEIKDPTMPTPISLSNEQSTKVSGGAGTHEQSGDWKENFRGVSLDEVPNSGKENDTTNNSQNIFLPRERSYGAEGALVGAGIAGILGGGYALYKKFKSNKKRAQSQNFRDWIKNYKPKPNLYNMFHKP